MRLEKKNVLVFGSGISGIGACRLLEENGADVILYDGNEALDQKQIKERIGSQSKAEILLGELEDAVMEQLDLCVISPGVPTCVGVRDYVAADKSGGGEAVLCPIFKCASDSKGFGGGGGRPALEVVGRSWILQPCAEHAESGKADHGRFSWRISQDLRGDKKSYRNRKLYGGSNQLICIWDSKTGGRWQCTSCGFEDHGKL